MSDFERERRMWGLGIDEFACVLGVHRQTMLKWERGEAPPSAAAKQLYRVLQWVRLSCPEKRDQLVDFFL